MIYHRGTSIRHLGLICLLFFIMSLLNGCSSKKEVAREGPLRDNTPQVLAPEASGELTYGNDIVSIDASHVSKGYIMVNYLGNNSKVKLQIEDPNAVDYTYLITDIGQFFVYPLTGGNGSYSISILESVDVEKDLYSISFTQNMDVTIEDEFLPFLYPNHYTNFDASSAVVCKGEELSVDCYSDLDVVTNVYNYVTSNISYDTPKAENLSYGYTPVPDDTLASGTGICFDYASLMTAMLRSQRIPTKLEVGYSGDVYHAWISCYVDEVGWVDDIIEFNGNSWSLMDPTLGASNKKSDVKKYVGDGSNYTVKYTY